MVYSVKLKRDGYKFLMTIIVTHFQGNNCNRQCNLHVNYGCYFGHPSTIMMILDGSAAVNVTLV